MSLKQDIALHTSIYNDFKPGVDFVDYNALNAAADVRIKIHHALADIVAHWQADYLYLPDARGFLLAPVADLLKLPLQMARKTGKLPGKTHTVRYGTEYSQDSIDIAAIDLSGKNIAILDDVLATGGPALAVAEAVHAIGGKVTGFGAIYQVDGLNGRALLEQEKIQVETFITVSEVKKLKSLEA